MRDGYQQHSDIHVLGWPSVWAITSTGLIIAIINGQSLSDLDEPGYALLGAASGCLVSTWILTGTWLGLAVQHKFKSNTNTPRRRISQYAWAAPSIVSALALIMAAWHNGDLFTKPFVPTLILTTGIAFTGPMIVWQWTHRKIHRGQIHSHQSPSILRILGIVLAIALAIGVVRMCQRWLDITEAATATIVSISLNWVLLLAVLLGKNRWFVLLLFALLVAAWVSISSMVDLRSQKGGDEIAYLGGLLYFSFGFSLLFLLQMRASGYRWLEARVKPDDKAMD